MENRHRLRDLLTEPQDCGYDLVSTQDTLALLVEK